MVFKTAIDMLGLRYGMLLVVSREPNIGRSAAWLCNCDCGGKIVALGKDLRFGNNTSCGCLLEKHGMSKSPEYFARKGLIQRCTNTKHLGYHNYGGRGITVCERWLNSFLDFLDDMGPRPGDGYSIERIDNDGPYCKENCKWATRKEQQRNHRRSRLITAKGKTQCLAAWAEETGLSSAVITGRINRGWTAESAVSVEILNGGAKR